MPGSNPLPVSSMSWLENDIILIVYTSNSAEDASGSVPPSSYYIVTRRKQAPFIFRKLPELCFPFGMKRSPAYQFISRLRGFNPSLKDILIVSSTASNDIGLISRSDQPLTDDSSKQTAGIFVSTEISDDARKAEIPLTESGDETSVIGLGIDLSSTENVASPIPGAEIAESATPLPNFLLLNNDGIVASWWFVYSESIRQKTAYPGLSVMNGGNQQPQQQASQRTLRQRSALSQPSFGTPSPLGAQAGLGTSSTTATAPAVPTFGSPSALGGSRPSTFGTSSGLSGGFSLSSSSASKPSFGTPSALGRGTPQFGQTSFGTVNRSPAFGQSSFGQPTPAPNSGGFSISGGGFGSFAKGGGFAGISSSKPEESAFSKLAVQSSPSSFGFGTNMDTAFAPQKASESMPSTGFVLGSTFKGDGSAVNDGPKPEKASGLFSLGTDVDQMISSPTKPSTPTEAMDDREDDATVPQQPTSVPENQMPTLFGSGMSQPPAPSSFSFANTIKAEQIPAKEEGARESDEDAVLTPKQGRPDIFQEQPLPPDSTSKAVFLPGDTSASSNVSKSSLDDVSFQPQPAPAPATEPPLPPDFTATSKKLEERQDTKTDTVEETPTGEPPLPPDFTAVSKKLEERKETKADTVEKAPTGEPPLPPDFTATSKEADESEENKAIAVEEAPLPPEPSAAYTRPSEERIAKTKESEQTETAVVEGSVPALPQEEEGEEEKTEPETEAAVVDEEEAEEAEEADESEAKSRESGFMGDSGAETDEGELRVQSLKTPEGSFRETQSPAGEPFEGLTKSTRQSRQFDEIPRSPSPVKPGAASQRRGIKTRSKAPAQPGATLAARRTALFHSAQNHGRKPSAESIDKEEEAMYFVQLRHQAEEEAQWLSDDDEEERLRADLARPLEPVPTLDPFLPHQDYAGEPGKPGVPGQIEKLYRDVNSMVDTLGINSRSLLSYIVYQETSNESDYGKWTKILHGDEPMIISDEKVYLTDIEKLDDFVDDLGRFLDQKRIHNVEEKLDRCRNILSNGVLNLRGQCAVIRKTLDAHTNTASALSASLSAEQVNMQQDLRTASTATQARLAELEQGISLLRARIADASHHGGAPSGGMPRSSTRKPTVEAVTSTIGTMMNMAESKSSDIDVLEARMKRLGIDVPGTPLASNHEGSSPLSTPKKGLFPSTPRSANGSTTAYHTPDSTGRFRQSANGSARTSRLGDVEGTEDYLIHRRASGHWKERTRRRKHLVDNLRHALAGKKPRVRGVDEP